MKPLLKTLFTPQTAIVIAALVLLYTSPLPVELGQLDQQLFELAGGHSGIDPTTSLQQPYWFDGANKIIWALMLAFLLLLLPWPNTAMGMLLTITVIAALIILQVGAQFRHGLWLPLGLLVQFLALTSPIILLWARRRKAWSALQQQRDQALIELAELKLQQGQLAAALNHLKHCQPSSQITELGYSIALQHEQRRNYKEAHQTYQWLASFAAQYKDVASKAKAPATVNLATHSNAFAATQSLIISSEQQRQPVLGRYRIERELGRGAMGVVYLGIDPKISRRVAIKTLNYANFDEREVVEMKQRFFREAEAAGRLTHPNIVTVYDVGEEPDLAFIAMDFIEGNALSDYTDANKLLEVSSVYQIIHQVADALAYAHQQNIVHRDIKPGNLILCSTQTDNEPQVKVADFGIARIVDNSSTKTGDILGSPIYMSPEQLKGHKVSGASDIYSLGVSFYQLLTGQPPYNGDSIANLAYQIINKKFKSPRELRPQLPASAVRIINKAMTKEPTKRFENATAMAAALRKALHKDFGIQ